MSDAFPFVGASDSLLQNAQEEQELPVLREYAWDFKNNKFLYDSGGRHTIVEGKEAVKVWVYKALATERYRYEAYSWQYGIEVKPFIGLVMSVEERISELKRIIIECLMVNPYIVSVDSFDFKQEGVKATVEIRLTTVYGEVSVSV